MTQPSRLNHPALANVDGGTALDQARLSDQQRLAVVLEAAALLGHLQAAHCYLPKPWTTARLDAAGRLVVGAPRPGRAAELVQVQLLRLLLAVFQSEDEIAGRGEARRAARQLLHKWRQTLTPMAPRDAVADIFEYAPFLWQPGFAEARATLAADLEDDPPGDASGPQLSLVAPPRARRRLLHHHRDLKNLQELLASEEARCVWQGEADADPMDLARERRYEQAVLAWQRQPPSQADATLVFAECLFAIGRYRQVLVQLKRHQRFDALLLRLWSQTYLGEIDAALKTLRRAEDKPRTAEQTLRLAAIAIRILAARRRDDDIRDWVAQCQAVAKGRLKPRASLLAAAAAWDREAWPEMRHHLQAAQELEDDAQLAGRWHHLYSLWARASADPLRAVDHMQQAIALLRRTVGPVEAGRLWNDLAISRAAAGDLAGAERACRHAVRLLRNSEGPGRTTLALYNLAEVRIRRGRLDGVETILEASTAANRRSKNDRGLIHDLELWVRYELAQGRAAAALARCAEAAQGFPAAAMGDRQQVFDLFAARAHGWLQRQDAAAQCLARVDETFWHELDVEERPAVLALAGLRDAAERCAAEGPWSGLWQAVLAGRHPTVMHWEGLGRLEAFRAARLVFDCELLLPGCVPPYLVRHAITTLQQTGAPSLAERLQTRSLSPWRALAGYLEADRPDLDDVARLFEAAGYRQIRLTRKTSDESTVLLDGQGGETRLQATSGDCTLVLETDPPDPILDTLFRVIQRDLTAADGPADGSRAAETPRRRTSGSGLIGESPELLDALSRTERLAGSRLPMLILGDSGTGKELAARLAHRRSPRADGPFVPINCAAISEHLIQSDLFGHVRGAFTGADRDRSGIFESAREGTVFLDEIGDLPLAAQGKLLRVLQENEVRRVGESFARKVDVRVVAATHRDLEAMVEQGEFRQDLFFRLKVATVHLPPLKDRGRDPLLLAEHFLEGHRRHLPHLRLSEAAQNRLQQHDWPGNVRELKNVLEVAAALAEGGTIEPEHLELPVAQTTRQGDYHRLVLDFRRKLVKAALEKSHGNRAEAARRLGLSRQALSYLVRQLGLT